jgi:hypothetical protein
MPSVQQPTKVAHMPVTRIPISPPTTCTFVKVTTLWKKPPRLGELCLRRKAVGV